MMLYILSIIFVHHYSVPVVIVAPLLMTDEFFANYGCPNVLIGVVATHCCSHHQLNGGHFNFDKQRPYESVSSVSSHTPMIRPNILNIRRPPPPSSVCL